MAVIAWNYTFGCPDGSTYVIRHEHFSPMTGPSWVIDGKPNGRDVVVAITPVDDGSAYQPSDPLRADATQADYDKRVLAIRDDNNRKRGVADARWQAAQELAAAAVAAVSRPVATDSVPLAWTFKFENCDGKVFYLTRDADVNIWGSPLGEPDSDGDTLLAIFPLYPAAEPLVSKPGKPIGKPIKGRLRL